LFGYGEGIRLALLIVLVLLSSLFSGAETALTSMNIIKVRQLKKKGVNQAAVLERIINQSQKILATILIGNNIVNIAATAIATELALKLFDGENVVLFVTIVMTITILVFGEITPKTYASHNRKK